MKAKYSNIIETVILTNFGRICCETYLILNKVRHSLAEACHVGYQWLNETARTVQFLYHKTASDSSLDATSNLQTVAASNTTDVQVNPKNKKICKNLSFFLVSGYINN